MSVQPLTPRLEFRLSASERDAADRYRDAFHDVFEAEVNPAGFHCQSAKIHLGSGILSRSRMAGQVFTRSRTLTRRNGLDTVQIICDLGGTWRGDYDGRSASGGPGTVRFVDTARPFVTDSDAFETIGLVIPRKALGKDWVNRDIHGLVLSEASASTRLLTSHIRTLWDTADTLTATEAAAAAEAAAVLAAGAISGMVQLSADSAKPIERTLLALARDYIDDHLDDVDLTPASVSSHLGLSQRTLYRVFRDVGGVSTFIQSRRLDRAHQIIQRGGMPKHSLAEIAYAHGFQSNAHFSRAFGARFGMPPGELRRQSAPDRPLASPLRSYGSTFVDWCQNL